MTARRIPFALSAGGSLALVLAALPAQAQELQGGVDVSVGAEFSSNPYLEAGDTEATGTATGRVNPWLQFDDGQTAYSLNASFDGRAFTSEYDFEDNYSMNLGLSHRANERLTLRAGGAILSTASSFSSLLARSGGSIDAPPLPTLPGDFDPGEDLTVLGRRGRNSALMLNAGAGMTFDARNQLQISGDFRDSWSSRVGAEDYRSYGVQARYMHVLGEATSIGTDLSYQQSDYRGAGSSDARTITTFASLNHRLGQYWTLDASVGASFTHMDASPTSAERDVTSFSIRSSLCNRTSRRGLCFDYRRLPEPSAFGGVRNSDNLGVSFDERVSERDRLSLGAGFVRNAASEIDPVRFPQIDYLSLNANFRRQVTQRLSAFVSGALAHISRPDLDADPNVTLGAGVTVSLGRPR